jgi:hypothetical protein
VDRPILYTDELGRSYDIGQGWRDGFKSVGQLAASLLSNALTASGGQAVVAGCTATQASPPSLSVNIGAGSIYALSTLDPNPVGSLPADGSSQFMQGSSTGSTVTLSTGALLSGQSQWVLIEAAFAFSDIVRVGDPSGGILPFYNAANPTSPLQGPGGGGTVLPTERAAVVSFKAVYGSPATTGSQVPPAADSGYVGLYLVLLTYGQTTITTTQILVAGPSVGTGVPNNYPVAPFLAGLLAQHHLGILGQAPQIDLTKEVKNILPVANLPDIPLTILPASDIVGVLPTFRSGSASPLGSVSGNLYDLYVATSTNVVYVCTAAGTEGWEPIPTSVSASQLAQGLSVSAQWSAGSTTLPTLGTETLITETLAAGNYNTLVTATVQIVSQSGISALDVTVNLVIDGSTVVSGSSAFFSSSAVTLEDTVTLSYIIHDATQGSHTIAISATNGDSSYQMSCSVPSLTAFGLTR